MFKMNFGRDSENVQNIFFLLTGTALKQNDFLIAVRYETNHMDSFSHSQKVLVYIDVAV